MISRTATRGSETKRSSGLWLVVMRSKELIELASLTAAKCAQSPTERKLNSQTLHASYETTANLLCTHCKHHALALS